MARPLQRPIDETTMKPLVELLQRQFDEQTVWNMSTLADAVGISSKTLGRILDPKYPGRRDLVVLHQLADLLGVDPHLLHQTIVATRTPSADQLRDLMGQLGVAEF